MTSKKPDRLLLVVAARAPVPGQVKTRLCMHLAPETAADLYRCFLGDRIEEMAALKGIDLAISYTPEDAATYFARFACKGYALFPQNGKDLGQRLTHIFAEKFTEGYDAVTVMDSDSPDLPGSIVQEAFGSLMSGQADAVFGPCHDGGYYLVGLREPHPELFCNIPWSTAAVLDKTLAIAAGSAMKTRLLAFWDDLDTFEDLLAYYRRHRRPGGDWPGVKTFNYLSQLEKIRDLYLKSLIFPAARG
ncbi:MAG: TIGR04282 family arsenosugar biosynthesis glycosyltransferase [Desulfobacterales bacterium]|nr:TIGR04282 family arsenosugar biosynthesis glycosyltransferase [Desulfobacterales bacterium]